MTQKDAMKHWQEGAKDAFETARWNAETGKNKLTRGLSIARKMKRKLHTAGIPVVDVVLFGSLVQGKTHKWSDVDIAVIHKPFSSNRMKEYSTIAHMREDFDVPMDILCFYPEDLENKYSTIAQEIKQYGIPV